MPQAEPSIVRSLVGPPSPNRVSPHIARGLAFITERHSSPLTTDIVAHAVGLERTYFSTLFRRETGKTIHAFHLEERVRRACELLDAGEKVEVVGLSVGYRSRTTFHRVFKHVTGMTPARWRLRDSR
jgi:AraC family transcriptional regulator of arabinose operon